MLLVYEALSFLCIDSEMQFLCRQHLDKSFVRQLYEASNTIQLLQDRALVLQAAHLRPSATTVWGLQLLVYEALSC